MKSFHFMQYGNPSQVLQISSQPQSIFNPANLKTISFKTLFFSINQSDLNQIQGTYPIRLPLTDIGYVPGNEGLIQVTRSSSPLFSVGDHCIPSSPCFGTWKRQGECKASDLIKVRKNDSLFNTSLSVNTSTAFRLLTDNPSSFIIQNGANCQVGLRVLEIAKELNIKTVSIVRDRPGVLELLNKMYERGADIIYTDTQLKDPLKFKEIKAFDIKVAFNCVGGKSAEDLIALMGRDATMVTYGGMSLKPILLSTSAMIFKNIKMKGFWMSEWYKQHTMNERLEMYSSIQALRQKGVFKDFKDNVIEWNNDNDDECLFRVNSAISKGTKSIVKIVGK